MLSHIVKTGLTPRCIEPRIGRAAAAPACAPDRILMSRFQIVRSRLSTAPPRGKDAFLYSALAVLLPTLVRASIDSVVSGTTFVAYFPFVLMAAMFLGWRNAT